MTAQTLSPFLKPHMTVCCELCCAIQFFLRMWVEFLSVILSFTQYISSCGLANKRLMFSFWKRVCGITLQLASREIITFPTSFAHRFGCMIQIWPKEPKKLGALRKFLLFLIKLMIILLLDLNKDGNFSTHTVVIRSNYIVAAINDIPSSPYLKNYYVNNPLPICLGHSRVHSIICNTVLFFQALQASVCDPSKLKLVSLE